MKPSIFIALPAYRGDFSAQTAISLARMTAALAKAGIEFSIYSLDYNDIAESRNILASNFLQSSQHSHMLMIDADMTFNPSAIAKMLASKADVVACAALRRGPSGQFNFPNLKTADGKSGEVNRIGTALMLVSRTALSALSSLPNIRKCLDHRKEHILGSNTLFGFFDRIVMDSSNLLSEDYSFCDRWVKECGGKIIAILDETIGHIGSIAHLGNLSEKHSDLRNDAS